MAEESEKKRGEFTTGRVSGVKNEHAHWKAKVPKILIGESV